VFNLDPRFVDPENGDLHIYQSSSCLDQGTNQAPYFPDEDFEADPRHFYTPDIGADEFYTHLYHTGEATPGGAIEIKVAEWTYPSKQMYIVLFVGSGVLDPPLSTIYGDGYLQMPLLFETLLGKIPEPKGVLEVPYTFPPDFPAPKNIPMQAITIEYGGFHKLTNLSVLRVE